MKLKPHDALWEILQMMFMMMGAIMISGVLQQALAFIPAGTVVAFAIGICMWILAIAIKRRKR